MRTSIPLALASLVCTGTALAQPWSKHPDRPPAVELEMKAEAARCRKQGMTARIQNLDGPFETRADVNGDGLLDHVVNWGSFVCSKLPGTVGSSGFCGSGGCVHSFYVRTRSGYRLGYRNNLHQWRVEKSKRPWRLTLSLHGGECGAIGASLCVKDYIWNGRRLVETERDAPRRK